MKISELRLLSVQELEAKIYDLEEEQLRLRCNKTNGQLENVQLIPQGRRHVARLKTIINEKKRNTGA